MRSKTGFYAGFTDFPEFYSKFSANTLYMAKKKKEKKRNVKKNIHDVYNLEQD